MAIPSTPPAQPEAQGSGAAVAGRPAATAEGASRPRRLRGRLARIDLAALLPAALVLFFSFQAGGFFPDSTGYAACALAIVLALRITLAEQPFGSVGRVAAGVGAALAGFLAWTLVSVTWSDAPARALLEFDRSLLYTLAFLVAATFPWDASRLARALRVVTAAVLVVCLVGWSSWVMPDVVDGTVGAAADRLSHPLTYWNGQGLIAALGALAAIHLACSTREHPLASSLGAAAVPLLASALFFTFSRGAFLAFVAGLAAYVILLRSRGLLSGALAVVGPTAMAVVVSFDADRLAAADRLAPAALAQGRDVALGVALCCATALLLRLAAARWIDRPLGAFALPRRTRVPVRIAGALVGAIVLVGVPLAAGLPGYLERSYDRFVEPAGDAVGDDLRTRFVNPANNGRLDHWRVGIDAWERHRVTGTGAGTYATEWNRARELDLNVLDAHSLYVEVLSELGIVGFLLLVGGLATTLGALALRSQGRRRGAPRDGSVDAVIVALAVAWAVQAGLDWTWELPALTAPIFALAGLALATRGPNASPRRAGFARMPRVALGIGCLVLAVIPFQVARSQEDLRDAVRALRSVPRDCPRAIDRSLASLDDVGARPEGWEIIAYCNVGAGRPDLAVAAARNAIARDPRNWTYRYALALVQGVAGQDPRPAARAALALNPRNYLAQQAVKRYERSPRRRWPAIARRLKLPST